MKAIMLAVAMLATAAAADKRPNLLIILTDDHGYGDVSAYQESVVRTPHIDRIGTEGVLFTGMRSNCSVCSPSRAAMLTGRNADRVGVPGVIRTQADNSWGYFDPAVPTLANELKRAGYHTSLIGKWHLGLASPNLPNERGFDFFHGFAGDMMDDYYKHSRHGNNYMRRNIEVTFLELAGAKPPAGLDAVSLAPILRGEALETPGRELYFVRREGGKQYQGQAYHALIRGDWKILRNDPFQPYELYHLKDDPQEKTDLAKVKPDIFGDLSTALSRHIKRGDATTWQPPAR